MWTFQGPPTPVVHFRAAGASRFGDPALEAGPGDELAGSAITGIESSQGTSILLLKGQGLSHDNALSSRQGVVTALALKGDVQETSTQARLRHSSVLEGMRKRPKSLWLHSRNRFDFSH
jgi:hypothetical protein